MSAFWFYLLIIATALAVSKGRKSNGYMRPVKPHAVHRALWNLLKRIKCKITFINNNTFMIINRNK